MALFRQAFTRAGAAPDLGALQISVRAAIGDPFYLATPISSAGVVSVHVDKPTTWTAPQITAVQSAVTAAAAGTPQTDAQNSIDAMPILLQAICLAIIDQLNVVRAGLPSPLGAITPAQAIAAIRTKAGTL